MAVADSAKTLVQTLQRIFKTNLISLCGEVRRQTNTVAGIEIIAAVPPKNLSDRALRRFMIIQSSVKDQTQGHTLDEIPVTIYHTTKNRFYYELFLRTGNESHVKKVLGKINSKDVYTSEEVI